MTQTEATTWQRRKQRLQEEEKRSARQATQLADAMQSRDRDLPEDNRRICPECRHWQQRKCTRGIKSAPYILQRFDCIDLRGASAAPHKS